MGDELSPEEPSLCAEVGLLLLRVREGCFPHLRGGAEEPAPTEVSIVEFGSLFCCPLPLQRSPLPQLSFALNLLPRTQKPPSVLVSPPLRGSISLISPSLLKFSSLCGNRCY